MVILSLLTAAAGCTAGTEQTPPLHCATFRPTSAQVRAYLTKAKRVPDL